MLASGWTRNASVTGAVGADPPHAALPVPPSLTQGAVAVERDAVGAGDAGREQRRGRRRAASGLRNIMRSVSVT